MVIHHYSQTFFVEVNKKFIDVSRYLTDELNLANTSGIAKIIESKLSFNSAGVRAYFSFQSDLP